MFLAHYGTTSLHCKSLQTRFPSTNPGVESFFLDLPQVGGVSYMTKAMAVGMKFMFRVNG